MPFQSKRQWRAAFAGHIPGFSKQKAKEWAAETDFSKLPDRAPAEKGKPTLRSKEAAKALSPRTVYIARKLREQLTKPDSAKGAIDLVQRERARGRNKEAQAFVEFCAKLAFAVPKPGQIMKSPRHIGSFSGRATEHFLKAPGSTTAAVTNPRLSLRNAMTKTMRA